MQEKNLQHIQVAKDLLSKLQEQTYLVVSNSMYPLIKKQDKVVCVKTDILNIKKYSIIAFHNRQNLDIPLVHRVIKIIKKNNVMFFQTKGDNTVSPDKELIQYSQIIGIVEKIVKGKSVIDLTKTKYKLYNLLSYFILKYINLFKKFTFKIKKIFEIEKGYKIDDELIVLRQSILTKIVDWKNLIKTNIKLLEKLINKDLSVCDISFGGGYCEESFNFIRKGFKIDYKKINDVIDNKYDFIICSRVINIVDNYSKRQKIYNCLSTNINGKGKILISYINQQNSLFVKLKRKLYKLCGFSNLASDDVLYNDIFVSKEISSNIISKELQNNNLKIINKIENKNCISFICSI